MGIQIFNAQPFQGLRARCADHGADASRQRGHAMLPSMNRRMMKALAFSGFLIATPAWAQGKTGNPADCSPIVQELKAKPPASGNKARAEALWDRFLEECRAKMGGPGVVFDAEEMMAIAQVLNLQTSK
jgi:hypothetical protein